MALTRLDTSIQHRNGDQVRAVIFVRDRLEEGTGGPLRACRVEAWRVEPLTKKPKPAH